MVKAKKAPKKGRRRKFVMVTKKKGRKETLLPEQGKAVGSKQVPKPFSEIERELEEGLKEVFGLRGRDGVVQLYGRNFADPFLRTAEQEQLLGAESIQGPVRAILEYPLMSAMDPKDQEMALECYIEQSIISKLYTPETFGMKPYLSEKLTGGMADYFNELKRNILGLNRDSKEFKQFTEVLVKELSADFPGVKISAEEVRQKAEEALEKMRIETAITDAGTSIALASQGVGTQPTEWGNAIDNVPLLNKLRVATGGDQLSFNDLFTREVIQQKSIEELRKLFMKNAIETLDQRYQQVERLNEYLQSGEVSEEMKKPVSESLSMIKKHLAESYSLKNLEDMLESKLPEGLKGKIEEALKEKMELKEVDKLRFEAVDLSSVEELVDEFSFEELASEGIKIRQAIFDKVSGEEGFNFEDLQRLPLKKLLEKYPAAEGLVPKGYAEKLDAAIEWARGADGLRIFLYSIVDFSPQQIIDKCKGESFAHKIGVGEYKSPTIVLKGMLEMMEHFPHLHKRGEMELAKFAKLVGTCERALAIVRENERVQLKGFTPKEMLQKYSVGDLEQLKVEFPQFTQKIDQSLKQGDAFKVLQGFKGRLADPILNKRTSDGLVGDYPLGELAMLRFVLGVGATMESADEKTKVIEADKLPPYFGRALNTAIHRLRSGEGPTIMQLAGGRSFEELENWQKRLEGDAEKLKVFEELDLSVDQREELEALSLLLTEEGKKISDAIALKHMRNELIELSKSDLSSEKLVKKYSKERLEALQQGLEGGAAEGLLDPEKIALLLQSISGAIFRGPSLRLKVKFEALNKMPLERLAERHSREELASLEKEFNDALTRQVIGDAEFSGLRERLKEAPLAKLKGELRKVSELSSKNMAINHSKKELEELKERFVEGLKEGKIEDEEFPLLMLKLNYAISITSDQKGEKRFSKGS